MTETALARAKVNLCLHVTGQRPDGYHLLDSLVVFADLGDRIGASPAAGLSLTITGPEGAGLAADSDNLVLRAAAAFDSAKGAALVLDKTLPIASGIGGGSADAAATLRALSRLWGLPLPDAARVLALGADVPVCLYGQPCRMEGVGEVITPLPHALPPAWLVLVNPRVQVSTPAVFRALASKTNAPMMAMPRLQGLADLAGYLAAQRNDLEAPAMAVQPIIATAKAAIAAQPGCALARMSGSGATCFGLFDTAAAATRAADTLRQAHPDWWIATAPMAA
jgi:4-diphosphocytidyl-2-C-methyl-D-erythritol kinase